MADMTPEQALARLEWFLGGADEPQAAPAGTCADALATLRAELDGLRRDAWRYRWLNNRHPISLQRFVTGTVENGPIYRKDAIDAAIDAAMQESSHEP